MVARLMYTVTVIASILFSSLYSKYETGDMTIGIPVL